MECLFKRNHFSTEQQALDEIAAMGWHALARDNVRTEDEPLHFDCPLPAMRSQRK